MYNKKFDLNSDMIYQQIKNEGEYNVNEIYHLKDEEYVFRHLSNILIKHRR